MHIMFAEFIHRFFSFGVILNTNGGLFMDYKMSVPQIKEEIRDKLSHVFGVSLENATNEEYYKAVVLILRELLSKRPGGVRTERREGRHQTDLLPVHGVPAGPLPAEQPV